MANFPGPFELRVFYVTNEPTQIASHVLRLSFRAAGNPQPGDDFSSIQTLDKTSTPFLSLPTVLSELLAVVRPLYLSVVDFVSAEVWRYPPSSFDAIFISAQPIGVGGSSTGTTTVAGQLVVTFRTSNGGIFKVDLRGTVLGPGVKQSFPTASTPINNLANHFLLPRTPFIGRDNGVPIAPLYYLPGQNERAWKRVFR